MPSTEKHFIEMMSPGAKRFQRDGKGRATYQKHKLDKAMTFVPTDRRRVCLDVGAHVGLWSMHLVDLFEYVHAFEPVPFFADLFQRNIVGGEWSLHPFAVGEAEAVVDVRVPLGQTGAAHVDTGSDHPAPKYDKTGAFDIVADVPVRTIDSFGFEDVDFVKIDVEGMERAVVQGAEQTLRDWKPVVVVEQKGNDRAFGDKRNAAVDLLTSWGAVELSVISGDYIMGWR